MQEFWNDTVTYISNGWNYIEVVSIICSVLYSILDILLVNAVTEKANLLGLIQGSAIMAMFLRWNNVLKYLRFNRKFSNLI